MQLRNDEPQSTLLANNNNNVEIHSVAVRQGHAKS